MPYLCVFSFFYFQIIKIEKTKHGKLTSDIFGTQIDIVCQKIADNVHIAYKDGHHDGRRA